MSVFEMEPYEFNTLRTDKDQNGDYHIYLETIIQQMCCPFCDDTAIVRNGGKQKAVRDINMFGGRVELIIDNPRYKCKGCGESFYNTYQSIDPNKRMTNRLREYIRVQSLTRPFSAISNELGVSDTTVKSIFQEHVRKLDAARSMKAPIVLGIDENHLHGQYRAVFTDVTASRILEILPNRSKASVEAFIHSLPGYRGIECFTMDMWAPYRDAVYDLDRDAIVIVDKFHVIKMLNEALESIRKSLRAGQDSRERRKMRYSRFNLLHNKEDLTCAQQEQLRELFAAYPEFEAPYNLKEEFRGIYRRSSRKEAMDAFVKWDIRAKGFPEFEAVARTVHGWANEIFNYFDHPYTNSVTESLNKVINDIDNLGKGYSSEVLRYKALYGTSATKQPKFRSITHHPKGASEGIGFMSPDRLFPWKEDVMVEGWGVDIAQLQDVVDAGNLFGL